MKPIGPLMAEHRLIERVVALMEAELSRANETGRVDADFIGFAVDFFRNYADACHHRKEELFLFRKLSEKTMPAVLAKIMDELIDEHRRVMEIVERIAGANRQYRGGDADRLGEIISGMDGLAELYAGHVHKEDRHFFFPTLDYLTKQEQEAMLSDFAAFDSKLFHDGYRLLVDKLERGC